MATTAYVLDVRDGWTRSMSGTVPWFLYAVLFASTSVIVGVTWDISWHRTIGRDTFWTPAHLAIYLGGIVAGLTCGWLALRLSFAHGEAADAGASRPSAESAQNPQKQTGSAYSPSSALIMARRAAT